MGYKQKLDHLSYRLKELMIEMFINALQKLKDRNEPLADSKAKSSEDG